MNLAARPLVPLGEFMLEKGGSVDPAKRPDDSFVLYSIPSFDAGKPETVSGHEIGSSKKKVKPGDVLLSRIVPHIRRGWIVGNHSKSEIIASGEWIVFRSEKIYAPYLRHFLVSDVFHPQFMKTVSGVGGSLLRAKPDYVAEIAIPLPPLDEQRRLAAILDKADDLRRKRKRALELLDSLAKSTFLHFFGETTSDILKIGKPILLSEVADIGSGITKGRKLNGQATRRVPYLAVANVQDRRLELSNVKFIDATESEIARYRLRRNDLLLTEGGDPDKLGRGTLWSDELGEAIHQNHIFRVRIKSASVMPLFLNWLVGSPYGKQYFLSVAKQTTGIASINKKQLSAFPTIVPNIDLQRRFVRCVETVAGETQKLTSSLSQMESLFSSLQHRAFSGQL